MNLFGRKRSSPTATDSQTISAQDQAQAFIVQGNALEESGRIDLALERYEAALRVAPGLPRAHLNLGNARMAMGQAREGIAAYERALALDPHYAGAHFNLGNACVQTGRLDDALRSYEKACELKPEFADAHVALGCVLDDLGRIPQAIASFRRALAIEPTYAQVHGNLGNALKRAGLFEEALQSHRRALELDPSLAQAHNNLGNALKDLGQLDDAEASYRQALALAPGNVDAFSNLLFNHNYIARHPAAQLLAEAQAFGEVVARGAQRYTAWKGSPDPNRPLRVGLVSGDLRAHPVAYFLDTVIAALGTEAAGRLQLIAYPTAPCEDSTTERIRRHCHAWHPVHGATDQQLAQRIFEDAIDILIDLSGHTAHNRLAMFAWKPSPVQLSWLGYFATTGVATIDYLIADHWTLPPGQEATFTEKIWRLPDTRLCFAPPDPSPPVNALPALSGGPLTFGCFNNLSKVNDAVVEVWSRVLAAVPASRLLLKSPQLREPKVRDRLLAAFAGCGIESSRLTMEGLASRFDYLAAYHQVDIALDPFPFPGGTTTAEALWMGVPVLTLPGDNFLSRQGVGLLMNAGLVDWVASDADHYVELAAAHAAELARLAALRGRLRQQLVASPVMDAPRFARHLEATLREMWRKWCGSQRR